MNPLISVPREALAELLRTAGSTLTPEEYVAPLPDVTAFKKYPSRAWAAAVSKYSILVVAIAAVVLLPFLGFTLENIIVTVGLITVTFFEYRVHQYFRERDPRAPGLGFRNQSAFAAAILIYCLYHAFSTVQLPAQDMSLVEDSNFTDPDMLKSVFRVFYLFLAVIVGGSQFALACYYRRAASI